ncbi:MAG: response regulator [Myxococcales bacterium]|nr:response regulator [Myxococcales bacterium]
MEAQVQDDSPRILVVDDEKVIREVLSDFLTMEGYVVRTVEDGESAFRELQRRSYNLVISDMKMPNMGGLELLEKIAEAKINVLVVIMTGFGTVETAIEAMKKGACDYLLKPFKIEEVVRVVQRGLDRQRLQEENIRLKEAVSIYKISEAIATSLQIDQILDVILEATVQEVAADLVTLIMRDPVTGQYVERSRKYGANSAGDDRSVGRVDTAEVLRHFKSDLPLLAHGLQAMRFFSEAPEDKRLVSFCSIPLKVQDRVIGMLNAYSYTRGQRFSEGQRKLLSVLASRAAVSIENARLYQDLVGRNRDLAKINLSLEENFKATIIGFAHALEESDRYTRGHSERVSFYSSLVAEGLGMSPAEIQTVVQAGLMHDIGKIGIRYEKLNKPGKLTPEEMAMFRTHPAKGKRILEPIPFMLEIIPGAWCHHENWDGSGYPRGLMGDNIPILGRIVAVADAYDAMTSDRSYRKALPHEVAVGEVERCAGAQFDDRLVGVFTRKLEEHRRAEQSAGHDVLR